MVPCPYHTLNTFLDYRVDRICPGSLRKERDRFAPATAWGEASLLGVADAGEAWEFKRPVARAAGVSVLACPLFLSYAPTRCGPSCPSMEEGIEVCGSDQLVLVICGGGPRVGDLAALPFTGKEGLYT